MVGLTSPTHPAGVPRAIRVLPALLVNQIAAGEVVERPASVVKELLDNAIDAGATRIGVELERGGIERIRVVDDGHGMDAEQLPLAVHPHATSKIATVADLDAIRTMGFRGEALASIGSVARLEIQSRARGGRGAGGHALLIEGGEERAVRPVGCPVGTAIEVRTLFFNTPARRKFLKSPATEQQHCLEIIRNLAIAHPAIGFRVVCDGREVLDLAAEQSPRERVLAILGAEHEPELIEAHADHFDDARGVALWGMLGTPVLAKQGNRHQRIFINGRPIRDKTIIHALKEAYRSLIEPSRHPLAVLMLEMDPGSVDVNVHPTKVEVRFRDPSLIHRVVYRAAKEALGSRDLTPSDAGFHQHRGFRFEAVGSEGGGDEARLPWSAAGRDGGDGSGSGGSTAERFASFLRARPAPQPRIDFAATRDGMRDEVAATDGSSGGGGTPLHGVCASSEGPEAAETNETQTTPPRSTPAARILQVHDSFLVTQDEDGVVIVDQHALHERVLYEAIHRRLAVGALESQRLLTPVMVGVSPSACEGLLGRRATLERFGIELDQAGPTTLALHAFPTLLFDRKVDPAVFVAELAERLDAEDLAEEKRQRSESGATEEGGSEGGAVEESASDDTGEDLLQDVVAMMACKAAVKAGDRLSEGELVELLRLRDTFERSSNCPHGRPTAIRLTLKELERQFGRLG